MTLTPRDLPFVALLIVVRVWQIVMGVIGRAVQYVRGID